MQTGFLSRAWKSFGDEARVQCILALCILISLGGIAFAFWTGNSADGQRGGAIAVILALTTLFATRSNNVKLLKAFINENLSTEHRLSNLEAGLKEGSTYNERAERRKNAYLASATAIGTLFWGFGDWMAASLMPPPKVVGAQFECYDQTGSPPFLFADGAAVPQNLDAGLWSITQWIDHQPGTRARLVGMIVIGSSDKRALGPRLRAVYRENPGLAMERGKNVSEELAKQLKLRPTSILTISSGPTIFDSNETANDRSVRICGIWK